ncbi:tetraspanin-33-like [Odontomachus brunneus]|uniref:tetraspanin-33-like n=1 Tax=Odontomachus brunneus TaxID=486640 RepID=UPI0013F29974|nr:tetraspanin-33-like [Odontomachus brunneus]
MAMLPLGLAPKTIKYLMFAFNLLFVVTAIALLSVGVVVIGMYYEYHSFVDDSFFFVPSLLIAVGSIIFIIALLGCCGAGRESYCMIVTFCTLLVGIFVLEIIGGTMGYVMRASVKSVAQHKMIDTMAKYNTTKEMQYVWDELQRNFDCCGTNNATDWINLQYSGIPMSCCDNTVGVIGTTNCTLTSPTLHNVGCMDAFVRFAQKHAGKIAGVGMGLGVIQLTGVMIISVGTTIYAVYENFSHFLDPSYFSPATLLIVVGILVFIIAFMGCCGALRESTCMVLVFSVLLSIVLLMELAAAVAAYALQGSIKGLLAEKINVTMHQYGQNKEVSDALDFLQSRLRCCGYNGPEDWNSIELNETITSCCDNIFYSIEENCSQKFNEGCINRLSDIIHRSALYIGTGAVAIALIQLTGIMFACMLGRAIRRQKTERERRRWELRENLVNGYEPLGKSDPLTTFPVVYMSPEYSYKSDQNLKKC